MKLNNIKSTLTCLSLLVASPFIIADEAGLQGSGLVTVEKKLEQLKKVEQSQQRFWLGGSARISPWLAAWQQKSTAASRFGSQALDVDYEIEQTIIPALAVSLRIKDFKFDLEVIDKSESAEEGEKKLNYLSFGVNYSGLTENLAFELGYLQGGFDGYFSAQGNDGREGNAKFSTELIIQDLMVVHKSGLGVGYRYLNYDLPQDVYLVHESAPNAVLLSGFENFEYSGHLLQVLLRSNDRKLLAQEGSNSSVNFSYEVRAGYGLMTPGGQYLSQAEQTNGKLMDDGSAYFYEMDVALYRQFNFTAKRSARIDFGYRASFLNAEFDANTEYALIADFETSFKGPYLSLAANF